MYRWTDNNKKRQTIYAKTLQELREKELEITKTEKINGLNWGEGKITVAELIYKYRANKTVKATTENKYNNDVKILTSLGIMNEKIKDIKVSDAKMYMIKLKNMGYSYGTVQNIKAMLSPAFRMAVEDDMLCKNPFEFRLCDLIDDDRKCRQALTVEQEESFRNFLFKNNKYKSYRNDVIILLGTGMRVSELYGLTYDDVDLKNGKIYVNKQLIKIDGKLMVSTTKSKAGTRTLGMTEEVRNAFIEVLASRKSLKTETMVDGYCGFIFTNRTGALRVRKDLLASMINMRNTYKKEGYGDLDFICPHVLRHTFCTRMIEKGMQPKDLQIVMGHSEISTTLDVYTHKDDDKVAEEMKKIASTPNADIYCIS